MLSGSRGALQQPANSGRRIGAATSSVLPRHASGALQLRGGALPLPAAAGAALRQRRPLRQRRRPVRALGDNGTEPGSWEDWEDEGELAAASSPAAAAWAGWYSPPQGQQRRQEGAASGGSTGSGSSSGGFVGRQGETQQLQASTSGRDHAPEQHRQQQHRQQQAAGQAAGFSPAPAPQHRWQRHQSSSGGGDGSGGAGGQIAQVAAVSHAIPPPPPRPSGVEARFFTLGAIAAVALHYLVNFAGTLPVVRSLVQQFVWWSEPKGPALPPPPPGASSLPGGADGLAAGAVGGTTALAVQYSEDAESVEWVNMCWRKAWRVYQRGIERWLADLLQPLFDSLVAEKMVPSFVQRLRIMEFTLDHEAPYFTNMRRRTSRKDSDLNGVVDVRYTGGARMLLLIEVGTGRWRIKIPVLVSDLDLESKLWLKIRLAPMCPWIGTLGLGFVGAPNIKVQLAPYNRIRLMKIPILQAFLTKLLTIDLPALMILPKRLEINIPPAVTAVAEAAVGRDAVMRAVASAVLQADALEHALLAALPLGPQGAAGGVSLPDLFQGELQVTLHEARDLPVWGFPWQSNPYCRITLGSQAVQSKRDDDTSHAGRHRAPVWNQDFQFLVEDPSSQTLDLWIFDSPMTGRTEVGHASFSLNQLAADGSADVWLPVESSMPGERTQGAVRLSISYKQFQEDEVDSGYRAAAAFAGLALPPGEITDIKTAADASSRAAVAASAAAAAVAVTKAAAARAAARIARGAAAGAEAAAAQLPAAGDSSTTSAAVQAAQASSNGSSPPAGSSSSSSSNGSTPPADGSAPPAATPAAAASAAAAVAKAAARDAAPAAAATVAAAAAAAAGPPGPVSAIGASTVEQLTAMAQTMQKLTAEVDGIVHSGTGAAGTAGSASSASGAAAGLDVEVKVAAVEAVAAAEAAAITAVAAGDLAGANQVLQDAAQALQSTVAQLAAAENGASSGASQQGQQQQQQQAAGTASTAGSTALTPQQRAEEALAAAHAAAAQAADAAAVAAAASAAVESRQPSFDSGDEEEAGAAAAAARASAAPADLGTSSTDEAVGLDAAPAAEAAEVRAKGLPSYDSEDNILLLPQEQQPWWLPATQFLPGVPRTGGADAAAGAAAEADGGAGAPPPADAAAAPGQPGPVADVVIPPDLPLDEITAEVLKSWKLRDTHVETLVQKAMEARRREKERPWVQLLAVASVACAALLTAVLFRLEHMP
ncbi:hypothetical protein ABPG75_003463 [Micractinium tetrahymenae]